MICSYLLDTMCTNSYITCFVVFLYYISFLLIKINVFKTYVANLFVISIFYIIVVLYLYNTR